MEIQINASKVGLYRHLASLSRSVVIFISVLFFIPYLSAYDALYEDYALKNNQRDCVLVIAYGRPDYFRECVRSLERNVQASEIPFVFALDGGSGATQEENIKIIEQSSIKHKIILQRSRNYGCPKSHIDAYRFVFDWCGFERMVMLEEDIVVTPTYLTFMHRLHSWATRTFDNVGIVEGYSFCYLSPEEKQKELSLVAPDTIHWLFRSFCMGSDVWHKIKSILYGYESFVDEIPLADENFKMRSKPGNWEGHHKVRKWREALLTKRNNNEHYLALSRSERVYLHHNKLLKNIFSSYQVDINQDVMTGFALYVNDLVKLRSVVNRATTIGEYGITESANKEMGLLSEKLHLTLDAFEEDAFLNEFEFVERPHRGPFMELRFREGKAH